MIDCQLVSDVVNHAPEKDSVFNNMHDYIGAQVEAAFDNNEEEFPTLPVSPAASSAAKLPPGETSHTACSIETATASILKSFLLLGNKSTKEFIALKDHVNALDVQSNRVSEKLTATVRRVTQLESYSRRWNLKLHGLVEKEQENLRKDVTQLFKSCFLMHEIASQKSLILFTVLVQET
ncbi:hypothetical protein WMY93_004178 [Mugilogobius chulae]|uniref:Uncharacterized protein n=1 Tax=Mugilogobius chulae TaxID=88201 RepID=A0AAW0PP37_9GOBI